MLTLSYINVFTLLQKKIGKQTLDQHASLFGLPALKISIISMPKAKNRNKHTNWYRFLIIKSCFLLLFPILLFSSWWLMLLA